MSARHVLLGLVLAIFISSIALANGGFYGSVTYNHCDCTWNEDYVKIQLVTGGQIYSYGIDCWGPGYTTDPDTFEPGWYRLWVDFNEIEGDCTASFPITVYHGEEDQEVNLKVQGNLPKPDGEGDE